MALYPDSLPTPVLMSATCPAQVSEALKSSAAQPNDKGDAAAGGGGFAFGLRARPAGLTL